MTPSGVTMGTIDPFMLGFTKCEISDLKGGDAAENARILREVMSGQRTGPIADTVVLNAGAGLYVAGAAASVADGCAKAADALKKGAPMETLAKWVSACKVPVS